MKKLSQKKSKKSSKKKVEISRQCPKNPAKEFKLKTVKKGLDGKMWIVSKRLDGIKVWKRKVKDKNNKKKGGVINYSKWNQIKGNENLENVINSGTLVTGKKQELVEYILVHDLTGYELKKLMLISKKWYNIILNNLIFLLPKLTDSSEIYNIMLRKILNKDLPKDDNLYLYLNYNRVRNYINNSNKKNLLKLVSPSPKNNKISIRVSNNKKSIILDILFKLHQSNPEYLLQLFIYASNIAMLKQGVLVIPEGTTVINNNNYKDDKLNTVIIPDSVISIGNGAFLYCYFLRKIIIPDSVITIGSWAFSYCHSLIEIIIPDSVTSIGEGTFSGCKSLRKITIPDSVTSIGEDAFYKCSSLIEIIIPDSVTSIGIGAFYGCNSLSKIYVSQNRINSKKNITIIEKSIESSRLSLSNINIIPYELHTFEWMYV